METRQLETRIASLRGQVRRLLALHGASWVVGLLLPLVAAAALADWLFHLDSSIRLVFLVALSAFGAWVVWRHVVTPLVVRFGDLDIALKIEERWPGLHDRLSSTVEFLRIPRDDDRHGSPELREATVRQTVEETRSIDFREVVDRRPLGRAALLAGVAATAAGALALADPSLARTGLLRLVQPYGRHRWPQQTHLRLLEPETPRKVARGDPFNLNVAVAQGERVPPSAKAVYRFDDGETLTEPLRSIEGGVFRGRLEAVERPFRVYVSAGDDSTSVRDVAIAVVPPPVVKDLTVRLTPPAYTGIGQQTMAPGKTQFRAVVGTLVEVEAVANKPIGRATLRLGEKAEAGPLSFDASRTRFRTTFSLGATTAFWFDLLDAEGFRNREATRYDLRSFEDEPPRVVIVDPTNDRDVPANARVSVAFTVDDDFGIHSSRMLYKVARGGSEPTEEIALPLFDGTAGTPPATHREIAHDWELTPLKLAPGSIITFHADARDFDTIKGPNLGKSRELRLRIVSDEDIARQLDDARRAIREDIEQILAMQNQARTPVDEAAHTLDQTGRVPEPARAGLEQGAAVQRQVSGRVANDSDGLDRKIGRFLDDLDDFKLQNPDARTQMESMKASVGRIRQDHLEPAEQGLTRASKALGEPALSKPGQDAQPTGQPQPDSNQAGQPQPARKQPGQDPKGGPTPSKGEAPPGDRPGETRPPTGSAPTEPKAGAQPEPSRPGGRAREALAEAQRNQKAIADELKSMLDGLKEFETYRGVVKDAQDLLEQHEQAMKQTAEAADQPDLEGKTPDQLSPEQKANLDNLAARQSTVGRNLQSLKEKMEQMAGRLDPSDPLAASGLREAAQELGQRNTGSKIGEASDRLQKNQMGAARSSQEQARDDLKNLVDSIQNRRERELARLVKELKNAEAELQKLRQRQTENLRKTREARKIDDAKKRADELRKLAKEEAEIQKELDRQLAKLTKLNAESAAQSGARAASKMGKASQDLDQDEGEKAEQEQDDALADLDDAQDRLEQTRKQAEEQLAMEQLMKMGDHLKSLAERQGKTAADIKGYEELRKERQGKLTLAQRGGVRDLAAVEEGLKDETGELAGKLDGAPVFSLTLKRAAESMTTAAQRLQKLETDEPTQRAAQSAAQRFQQLLESLKPDKPKNGGGDGGGGGGGGGGGDGIPPAAQVKMLKALQQEINERTEYYDELKRRKTPLTPEQTGELDRLEEDQGTLADLVRDLSRPKLDDAEE